MDRVEVFASLNEVFREYFDDETIELREDTTSNDIDGWDSLEHINLIVAVENKFGIKFNIGEVSSFQNVGEMADTILKKI